jgi:hypothetical protein
LQCPRCQFENLPGQDACFRCGSLLTAKAGTVEVHPPRAPAWKKPFRRVARWMRHRGAVRSAEGLAQRAAQRTAGIGRGITDSLGLPRSAHVSPWVELRSTLSEAALSLALSIVPGLAHLVRGQFGTIYLYVISWFVSLVVGILYFGQSLGAISMTSAFVLHAWIAMDAVLITKRFQEAMTALARIGWRLCGLAVLALLLYGVYTVFERTVGYTVGVAGIAVPAHQVELRDSILCRFLEARLESPALKRGDLVLVRVRQSLAGDGRSGHGAYLGETVGQLIALPGDELALAAQGFTVNGRVLDLRKFPIPVSLNGQSGSVTLGKDEYFVTMEWRAQGHGVANSARVALRACVYGREDVLARGVMRWFPMRKRGLLEELE